MFWIVHKNVLEFSLYTMLKMKWAFLKKSHCKCMCLKLISTDEKNASYHCSRRSRSATIRRRGEQHAPARLRSRFDPFRLARDSNSFRSGFLDDGDRCVGWSTQKRGSPWRKRVEKGWRRQEDRCNPNAFTINTSQCGARLVLIFFEHFECGRRAR